MVPHFPDRQILPVIVVRGIIHKLAHRLPELPAEGLAELLTEINAVLL
jgi:hypothetical protein